MFHSHFPGGCMPPAPCCPSGGMAPMAPMMPPVAPMMPPMAPAMPMNVPGPCCAPPPCAPIPLPGCCGTQELPPVCHPPIEYVKHNHMTHIVPHIHPVNETTLTTHVYQHNHYFPHQCHAAENCIQHEVCCGSPAPQCC